MYAKRFRPKGHRAPKLVPSSKITTQNHEQNNRVISIWRIIYQEYTTWITYRLSATRTTYREKNMSRKTPRVQQFIIILVDVFSTKGNNLLKWQFKIFVFPKCNMQGPIYCWFFYSCTFVTSFLYSLLLFVAANNYRANWAGYLDHVARSFDLLWATFRWSYRYYCCVPSFSLLMNVTGQLIIVFNKHPPELR